MAEKTHTHVCPRWVGYFLLNPLRKWMQNPEKILGGYLEEGMVSMDIGSAMGFFSIPMAKMVGEKGKVVCVDLQEKMIATLLKRAQKANVASRIETVICSADSLCIDDYKEKIDFLLTFAVVHETPDPKALFKQLYPVLKPGGKMLIAEPRGHVSEKAFKQSIDDALEAGFKELERPGIKRSLAILMEK
ncbi:MAG: class I SAM-dependent methyltransferase [bacterium]|nr:class I SAM-dependent methyltransferase [bacterium]